ncbi:uncharacterized protein si:ch211-227n13.3 isoform X2 [Rhincodon typus]|uniref:uncharacterized protein si:ch211-227n13.3 isoform X2 n=1 Tax=Rhincodon typus TaxID=259920 RepID=UPI00202E0A24|nr:uncharacterized protein si:ch211-227n13.3 isoform X2 [Rhincodon typus]
MCWWYRANCLHFAAKQLSWSRRGGERLQRILNTEGGILVGTEGSSSRNAWNTPQKWMYRSLFGTKEKVQKTALEDDHFAPTTTSKDLGNFLGLENLTECSTLSEQVVLKNSDSGRATTSTCSSESETARLLAEESNLKWNPLLRKAKENLMSNADTLFFTVKQPISQIGGPSPQNHDGNEEEIFELSCDEPDGISTNSGEDYRETVTCEACSNVFWKVINRKETKKRRASHKKPPYDPSSLSCDQWILKKPLLPRSHVQKSKREIWYLKKSVDTSTSTRSEITGKWVPRCSRPHVFLQRNLRSCKRKVDAFLAEHRKKQPQRTKKRSKKKQLFIFKLPESPSSIVISDNETSEVEISTVKRKLTSAVLSRGDRTKKSSCDFSDDSITYESGFYSSDYKSVQFENSTSTNVDKFTFDFRPLNFVPDGTAAFSTSTSLCPENQLCPPNEKGRKWAGLQSKSHSFGWLKPSGFTSMIAKLKARPLTTSGSVVNET